MCAGGFRYGAIGSVCEVVRDSGDSLASILYSSVGGSVENWSLAFGV